MRRMIFLLIVALCGLASADVLRPLGEPADIPADVEKFVEHSGDGAGQFTIKIKPHGDGVIRVPVTSANDVAVSSDQLSAAGNSAFVPDQTGPPASAMVEFWSNLSDGSHVVSKASLPTTTQPTDLSPFEAGTTVGKTVWPVVTGVDLVVAGSGTVCISGLVLQQTAPVAAAVGDGPVIAANERIVRAYQREDLTGQIRGLFADTNFLWRADLPNDGYLAAEPLYDGSEKSAFAAGLGGENDGDKFALRRIRLLVDSRPKFSSTRFAVVGRLSAVSPGAGTYANYANVRLELAAECTDGAPLTASYRMAVTDLNRYAAQPFRLQIENPRRRQLSRLTLDMILPARSLVDVDGIDLVEPGAPDRTVPTPAAPSRIPAGYKENVVVAGLSEDPEFVQASGRPAGFGPVAVYPEGSGWQVYLNRPRLDGMPRRLVIATQDTPTLKPGTLGITGQVRYDGLDPGTDLTGPAWLELATDYADGTHTVTGTTADSGLACRMTGHSSPRPFAVATTSTAQPVRFKLELVGTGTGIVHLSSLSLVQYEPPAPPPPATQPTAVMAPPAAPPWWSLPRYTRPIGFGIAGLMGVAAVAFLFPGVASQTWGLLAVLGLVAQAAFAWGMFLLGRGQFLHDVVPLLVAPLAWLLPAISRGLVFRKVRRNELRRMFTLDAAS